MNRTYILGLIGISLTAFLTSLDFAIVNAALPVIQQKLHMSIASLQWVMNIYVLVIAMTLVMMGRTGDILGHKKILAIGVSLFILASLICGLAHSGTWLILGRGLQGLGSAIIIPCSLALVSSSTPEKHHGKAIGIWTSVSGIGFASGPVAGGLLVSWLGWQSIFFINIPFGILALILFITTIKETATKNEKIDFIGFCSLAIAICAFTMLLIEGNNFHWHLGFIIPMLIIILIALFIFFRHESKTKAPMLKLSLLKHPSFLMGALANFSMVFYAYVGFFLMPLFLSHIRGDNPAQIGLTLLPITLSMVIVSPLVGIWIDKTSFKQPLIMGLSLLMLSAIMQFTFYWQHSIAIILIAFALMGIAWGCIFGSSAVAAIDSLPKNESGQATGALWTIQNIGGTVGLTIATLMFGVFSKQNFMFNYSANMLLLTVLVGLALVGLLLITHMRRHANHSIT